MHGAAARSRVMVTLPLVMASTYFTVPVSRTPVVGGRFTGLTGTPLRVYSQVAPETGDALLLLTLGPALAGWLVGGAGTDARTRGRHLATAGEHGEQGEDEDGQADRGSGTLHRLTLPQPDPRACATHQARRWPS